MADTLGMASQLISNAVRFGWFLTINEIASRQSKMIGGQVNYTPQHPVPTRQALLENLRQLLLDDAQAVRDRIYAPTETRLNALPTHVARLRAMLSDLPGSTERRRTSTTDTAKAHIGSQNLPEYFIQDFHYQNGGHLSQDSASLYDVQVETLFYGSAGLMRRSALRPLHKFMSGRDQRRVALLDVACGTGRFLRDVRLTYPAMQLTGLDLSQAYLDEAKRHLKSLRPVAWSKANAEQLTFDDGSQDVVSCIFLFHELPPEVRRTVADEIARVLKPGGLFLFIDSLQMGDKPEWDGLLEAFPVRFHEPYYRHYSKDDLQDMFEAVGLGHTETRPVFLSKLMTFRKAHAT